MITASVVKNNFDTDTIQRMYQTVFWDKIPKIQGLGRWNQGLTSVSLSGIIGTEYPLIETTKDNQLFEARGYSTQYQTSPCVFMADVMPSYPANSGIALEIINLNSEVAPNYATLQALDLGAYYGVNTQNFLPPGGDHKLQQQLLCQQLDSEQSQTSQFIIASFGVKDLQPVRQDPGILSEVSQIQDSPYGSIQTDFNSGSPSFSQLDLAPSLLSSSSPFHASSATTLGYNYNRNMDNNPFNSMMSRDMNFHGNTENSSWSSMTTASSSNPIQDLGSPKDPIEICTNTEDAQRGQSSPAVVDGEGKFPRIFGPSRQVVLPPARRGGRKGPRSALELKNLREARKQGVCIRCRRMKEKLDII